MAVGYQHKMSKFEKFCQNLCTHMPCFHISLGKISVSFFLVIDLNFCKFNDVSVVVFSVILVCAKPAKYITS